MSDPLHDMTIRESLREGGESVSQQRQWREPDKDPIHLANNKIVEANVNGKDFDGLHGWVLADGREIKVRRNEAGVWEEESDEQEI